MFLPVNGQRVFASTGGRNSDPNLPTVIFLHGSGLDHTFWTVHAGIFSQHNYGVLVPDLPGHSDSEGQPLATIESMADWLNALINVLGIDNISLVAHSQGCLITLEYASRFPDRLRSLSLIASGVTTPVNSAFMEAAENRPKDAIEMMLSWGFGPAGSKNQASDADRSILAKTQKVLQKNTPGALAADLNACNSYQSGAAAAQNICVPSQVILAEYDRMASKKVTGELIRILTNPEVQAVKDCGHMLPLEKPGQTSALLKAFIFANNPAS